MKFKSYRTGTELGLERDSKGTSAVSIMFNQFKICQFQVVDIGVLVILSILFYLFKIIIIKVKKGKSQGEDSDKTPGLSF